MLETNFNTNLLFNKNASENIVWENASILILGRWVKADIHYFRHTKYKKISILKVHMSAYEMLIFWNIVKVYTRLLRSINVRKQLQR